MNDRRKAHYKASRPEQTVKRILCILHAIGVTVREEWNPQSEAQTHSLRLIIEGTELGTNGKGMTKDFARASAYAELMERLQNRWLARFYFDGDTLVNKQGYYVVCDEKMMTTDEVAQVSNSFFDMLYSFCAPIDSSLEERKRVLEKLQQLEFKITGKKNIWVMVPFYSLREQALVYLPYYLYSTIYGSNGMCAGNTHIEAMIQGLSEVFERYVQREVIEKAYTLPDISDEYFEQNPEIGETMQALHNIPGYRFILKDCSMAGHFPVAALATVELNSGCYGIKFGCHPDPVIAIERTITETNQGISYREYCRNSKLDFDNNVVHSEKNIGNIFHSGRGQYPFEFFLNNATFPSCWNSFSAVKSDMELLEDLVNCAIESNRDVYIRDVSVLGFPSYHIIVPFMSEMVRPNLPLFSNLALKHVIAPLINQPNLIAPHNVPFLCKVLSVFGFDNLHNTIKSLSSCLIHSSGYPAEDKYLGWLYMLVLCQVMQGEYGKAQQYMKMFLSAYPCLNDPYYSCLATYLHGMTVLQNHNQVIAYLKTFFDENLCERIDTLYQDPSAVFEKQMPEHILEEAKCTQEHCCDYYAYLNLMEKIGTNQEKHQIQQMDIQNVFLVSGGSAKCSMKTD